MSSKKHLAVALTVALVTALLLTMVSFASVDGVGGGFSLWNLLDGLGGFFRDTINAIGGFFANMISALKNAANALLDAITKVISAISNAISWLLSGLKTLFIPSKESFSNFRDDILTTYDKKFGSVFSALDYLDTRFKGLEANDKYLEPFNITFPKGSFLSGLTVNLIENTMPVFSFIRVCMTGLCCLVTALICYRKVIAMVNK